MARKISRETSLDRALTMFWDHGFRGTSMDMLTAALGVEKPSIYANFGSKKELYLEALASYQTMLMARVSGDLQSGGSARKGVNQLICNLLAPNHAKIRRGCMATNSTLEMADLDPEIQARVKETFKEMLAALTQAIRRGQQDGDIRNDRSAGALAQFIVGCVGGTRVLEKTSVETPHWAETVRLALSVLDPPAKTHRPAPTRSSGLRGAISPKSRQAARRKAHGSVQ
ncbi:MAG: TetR/AcrR family transcriptional regulator [Gammaproteobacteria bacterium]